MLDIRRNNPWWEGRPGKQLPPTRRDFVNAIHRRLRQKLAPIIVVRGPRQVGKTTAQFQIIADLLASGVSPDHILRVQFDELPGLTGLSEPILRIVEWYEQHVLRKTLNEAARDEDPTYLFFDEVQNLSNWAVQLKHLADTSTIQMVVTGSSALRIEAGRDSLAGRINSIEVGTLKLNEIAAIRSLGSLRPALPDNGLEALGRKDFWEHVRNNGIQQADLRDATFTHFSERGGYPIVHERPDVPWPDVADQLNETVIRRVIQHDLRLGNRGRGRDPALLEELFRLGSRYAGQCPSPDTLAREAERALHSTISPGLVRRYLDLLDRSLLLRLVRPLELRLNKNSQAPAKLCLADHGLRASWLQEIVPVAPGSLASAPHLADMAGRIAESIVGSYLLTIGGLDLAHFPERCDAPEVDFVITIGTRRIPIEVKYRRRIDAKDSYGLRCFMDKEVNNAPFGILITQTDAEHISDPRIVTIPLSSLLLLR